MTNFIERDDVSMHLPYKRQAKNVYMRSAVMPAYKQYCKEQEMLGSRVLSLSSFYKAMPKCVKYMHEVPFRSCLCEDCLNFSLLIDALRAAQLCGILQRMTSVVLMTLCTPPDFQGDDSESVTIGDCDHDCIFRSCKWCGYGKLKQQIIDNNATYDFRQYVTWHQWRADTDPDTGRLVDYSKVRFRDTAFKLLDLFSEKVTNMSTHLFHFRWQAAQFEAICQSLSFQEALMVMDFAQNYEIRHADEPQSSHWHHKQVTLHPVVTYFGCPDCEKPRKMDLIMMSDDQEHDAHAVKAFEDTAVGYLREEVGLNVTRVIQFTDNCAAQYKSKLPFQYISEHTIPWERHYFGAKHGKGPADAAIGHLKRRLDDHQRTEQCDFRSAEDIYDFALKNLIVTRDVDGCCHPQSMFFYVTDIDRTTPVTAKTLPGTQQLHSVRSTGVPGYIERWDNSCFCPICELDCTNHHASLSDADAQGPMTCVNERLVTPHTRKNIFGNEQTVSPDFLNIYFRRSDVGDASAARTRAMTAVKGKGRAKKPAPKKPTTSATDQSQAKTTRASQSAGRVTQTKGAKPATRSRFSVLQTTWNTCDNWLCSTFRLSRSRLILRNTSSWLSIGTMQTNWPRPSCLSWTRRRTTTTAS